MKPESHMDVTAYAIRLYQQHKESVLSDALRKHRYKHELLRGTKDEDSVSPTRLTNWHFYPANDVINNYEHVLLECPRVTITPTSLPIMMYRQERFMSALKDGASEWLFFVFGRMLHHIQDMSTPSHVVPVYHDPFFPDAFEHFLVDYWDEIKVRLATHDFAADGHGTGHAHMFVDLYRRAGDKLQGDIAPERFSFNIEIDGATQSCDASLLWKTYDPLAQEPYVLFDIPGFGDFGPVGRNFGDLNFTEGEQHYRVALDAYLDIAEKFMRSAVADTLRALHIFERIIGNHFRDRPFVVEENPFLDEVM